MVARTLTDVEIEIVRALLPLDFPARDQFIELARTGQVIDEKPGRIRVTVAHRTLAKSASHVLAGRDRAGKVVLVSLWLTNRDFFFLNCYPYDIGAPFEGYPEASGLGQLPEVLGKT